MLHPVISNLFYLIFLYTCCYFILWIIMLNIMFVYYFYKIIEWFIERLIHRPCRMSKKINTNKIIKLTTYTSIDINCYISKPTNNYKKYIIYSYDNKTNIFNLMDFFDDLSDALGVCIIGYDYIGYDADSKYYASENRCYDSLDRVIDYVKFNLGADPKNIYLMGKTIGAAVVLDYLSKNNWNTDVMLISPFLSINTLYCKHSVLSIFDKYNNRHKISRVTCPVHIIYSDTDNYVYPSESIKLFDMVSNPSSTLTVCSGATHQNILNKINMNIYENFII